jgi:GDPmannose 4,6-dehydratase
MKNALITGISGQDGFLLAQLLLKKGYRVTGILRRNSQMSQGNLIFLPEELKKYLTIDWGDVSDSSYINNLINRNEFQEVYHLAAQSFVALSFNAPDLTYQVNIDGTLNIVNAIKSFSPSTKLYFAATSEMYGKVQSVPQNEQTSFYPRSPYAVSKLAGFWTCKNYRESYNLFFSNGILFNHESEYRGKEFVTRKITSQIAEIFHKKRSQIELGNLNAMRDWGYAGDYVEGMWLMLQHKNPDDFVLASGKNYSIREFIQRAFSFIDIKISWEGEGISELGRDAKTGKVLIKVNPEFFRPAEVETLLGDSSRAEKILGWKRKTSFDEMIEKMVKNDITLIEKGIDVKVY